MAALGLHCCMWTFSGCAWASHSGGFSFAEHRLWSLGSEVVVHGRICFMACGLLFPGPGIDPLSPALAGRFLFTVPPGESPHSVK